MTGWPRRPRPPPGTAWEASIPSRLRARMTRARRDQPDEPPDVTTLFLDPSSTACGLAVHNGRRFAAVGVLAPSKGWDEARRLDWICEGLASVVREHRPELAVMEQTTGITGHRMGNSVAVLCRAQGEVRRCLRMLGLVVETVAEGDWTQRRDKYSRADATHAVCPAYAAFAGERREREKRRGRLIELTVEFEHDPGLDAADAAGLALWWLEQRGRRQGRG
jgi:hypothetical protein